MDNNTYKNNDIKNFFIILAVVLLIVSFIAILIFYSFSGKNENKKKENDPEEKEEVEQVLVNYSDINNYSFNMTLDFMKDSTVVIEAVGFYDKNTNSEEYSFKYNGATYKIITFYSTGNVLVYDNNGLAIKRYSTEGKYTLNLESIINKINNKDSYVTNIEDNRYYVKIDTNNYLDDIFADVTIENGYIKNIKFDLSNLLSSEGYKNYIVSYDLYDYNK